jgi:hypothetical protein
MKSIIILTILALATSQVDLQAQPIPVIKCFVSSEVLKKDVLTILDAVNQFTQDKNILLLVSKIMGVYPELEKEVKRCLAEENIELQGIKDLPEAIKKIWEKIPKAVRDEIVKFVKTTAKKKAKELCQKLATKFKFDAELCNFLDVIIKDD